MENCVLRPAAAADYAYIAEWAPDAAQCRLFSGSADYFPYDTARLPEQLDLPGSCSFVLLHRGIRRRSANTGRARSRGKSIWAGCWCRPGGAASAWARLCAGC